MADDPDVPPPALATDRLTGGWTRTGATVERLFAAAVTDVRGHTVVYEDDALRAAVRRATGGRVDRSWRFFFATRLRFRPPLPPGVGPLSVLPTVRREAVERFVETLRDRGVTDLERGRRERLRTDAGRRVRLRQVTGRLAVDEADADSAVSVPVEGWVGAWAAGDVHLAGGAYPATALADALGDVRAADDPPPELTRSLSQYREDLFALVRGVG